jgi:hypothetical protein
LGKLGKTFGEDRTSTRSIVTGETAHREMKLNRTSRTGNVCEAALILAMDARLRNLHIRGNRKQA